MTRSNFDTLSASPIASEQRKSETTSRFIGTLFVQRLSMCQQRWHSCMDLDPEGASRRPNRRALKLKLEFIARHM